MASLYYPLMALERQIRLLTIVPTDDDADALDCRLTVSSLDAEPASYNTLSYRWGDSKDTRRIQVNGHQIDVTANLAAALRHLRNTGDAAKTPVWIDAICINQADLDERSSQVSMMQDIYAQARCVHIWLGDQTAVSDDSMLAWAELVLRKSGTDHIPWTRQLQETTLDKVQAIGRLADNAYWKRTWILQEIAFAEEIIMHSAGHRIVIPRTSTSAFIGPNTRLEELQAAVCKRKFVQEPLRGDSLDDRVDMCIEHIRNSILAPILRANWSRRVAGFVQAGEVAFTASINELFFQYRESLATDPRDKIYGLLGIAPALLDMRPDYTKSIREVYTEASVQLIRVANHLELLNQACSGSNELPSWVPDFSSPCRVSRQLSLPGFTAHATLKATPSYDIINDRYLKVNALNFDGIVQIKASDLGLKPDDMSSVRSKWQDWLETLSQWKSITTRESAEAVVRLQQHTDPRVCLLSAEELSGDLEDLANTPPERASESMRYAADIMQDYDLFLTAAGYIGVAPKGKIDDGEVLVLIAGASTPFAGKHLALPDQQSAITLHTPCVVDASFPDNINHPMERVALEGFHVRLMDGGLVVAEAIRRFGEANRYDDVFGEMLLA